MITIGIDFGGTLTKIASIEKGKIIHRRVLDSYSDKSFASTILNVQHEINEILETNNLTGELKGIGISIPGIVDSKNLKLLSINDKFIDAKTFDFRDWGKRNWNVPISLENDARSTLIGEWQYGKGKGYNNIVMITLGTGIGTAALVDGKVLRGKHFIAGILGGHFIINEDGFKCNCGNIGCSEAQASTWNLNTLIRSFNFQGKSILFSQDKIDYKTIFTEADKEDALAIMVRDYSLNIWTKTIVNLIYAYDPEIIILAGGIMKSAKHILPFIKSHIYDYGWASFENYQISCTENIDDSALLSAEYLISNLQKNQL